MGTKDRILAIIREKGPVIPVHVSKEINTSILMASVLLSELVKDKTVKFSSVKIGSSPLYYIPGQESKLQQYSSYLPAREREAYELLKQSQVLRDSKQSPVTRAALREIRDFAKPIEVTVQGNQELFWKWYLSSEVEVEKLVKGTLGIGEPKKSEPEKPTPEPKQEPKEAQAPAPKQEPKEAQAPAPKEEPKKPELKPEPKLEPKPAPKPIPTPEPRPTPESRPTQKPIPISEPKPAQKPIPTPEHRPAQKPKPQFVDRTTEDEFMSKITWFFRKNEIEIIEKNIIRKKTEIDLIVRIPSPVGPLKYYCKAKNKARVSDRDLSSAYVQGQMKKLPVLFIYSGEITKKAKEMLHREFENMTLKNI